MIGQIVAQMKLKNTWERQHMASRTQNMTDCLIVDCNSERYLGKAAHGLVHACHTGQAVSVWGGVLEAWQASDWRAGLPLPF